MRIDDIAIFFAAVAGLGLLAQSCYDLNQRAEERKVEKACAVACAPMAYTGFYDDAGCWCRAEDPKTLKLGE